MSQRALLDGTTVVSLAPNVPGPVAAARLRDLGARLVKIEPPAGDLLARSAPYWYAALHRDAEILTLDLKTEAGRAALDARLADADLLLTSSRPSALVRLGLGWSDVHARHPNLAQVAIVGELPPHEEHAGHDLTYVAQLGMLEPPALPRTLVADLAGAERAVSAALGLLLRRARGEAARYEAVSLRDAAVVFAEPFAHGMTAPGGILGGGFGGYRCYRASDGWIAVAALEPQFERRLVEALGVASSDAALLEPVFASRDVAAWLALAEERDLPFAHVR